MKRTFAFLDESLVLFLRAVRRHFWALAAIFLPVNLLTVYLHCRNVQPLGEVPLAAIKPERDIELLYGAALCVLVALLIVRTVWRQMAKPTDENALFESAPVAWRQAFGTQLLTWAAVMAAVFIPFAATSLMVRYLIPATPPAFALLVTLLGVVFVLLALLYLCRWMLAIPLSLLFGLPATRATDASCRMLKGGLGRILWLVVLAALVSVGMSCLPEMLRYCDLLGLWYPFTTLGTAGCVVTGVLMAVMGTVASLAHLYVWSVLTVYVRERMEGAVDVASARPWRVVPLAVLGLLFGLVVVPVTLSKGKDLQECRVFRAENMDPDEAYARRVWNDSLLGSMLSARGMPVGRCCLEKRELTGGREGVLWVELPFCSHCGAIMDKSKSGCCTADVYAFKCAILENYEPGWKSRMGRTSSLLSPGMFHLLPSDVQRRVTDEERARFNRGSDETDGQDEK